jgi:hypothetical protein
MILGMSIAAFVTVHVILSLMGIVAGLILVFDMIGSKHSEIWAAAFLATTRGRRRRPGISSISPLEAAATARPATARTKTAWSRDARIVGCRQLAPPVRAEALRFLIHFVGDVHQPLHAADNNDRGGSYAASVRACAPS